MALSYCFKSCVRSKLGWLLGAAVIGALTAYSDLIPLIAAGGVPAWVAAAIGAALGVLIIGLAVVIACALQCNKK